MQNITPKPIFNELKIKGLKKPFTILQIADLHLDEVSPEEAATMSELRLKRIGDQRAVHADKGYSAVDAFPALLSYAEEISADVVLFTGDVFTFPSETNFRIYKEGVARCKVPCQHIVGNHDWSFIDDDLSTYAVFNYYPRVMELSGGSDGFAYSEYDGVIIAAVDDAIDFVHPNGAKRYYEICDYAKEVGKPVILGMHIPMEAPRLAEICIAQVGYDLSLGPTALGSYDPTTVKFWHEVTKGSEYAPAVILTGHFHISHEEVLSNGVTQYVTDLASGGACRVLRLIPDDVSAD